MPPRDTGRNLRSEGDESATPNSWAQPTSSGRSPWIEGAGLLNRGESLHERNEIAQPRSRQDSSASCLGSVAKLAVGLLALYCAIRVLGWLWRAVVG
jgi:hypothetical protein